MPYPIPTRDDVVFFDLETGGTESCHPTIQIAAAAVDISLPDWPITEKFERKVPFNASICDPAALELNHYDPAVWEAEAIPATQVKTEFKQFLSRHTTLQLVSARGNDYTTAKIAGHNIIRFDLPRLDRLFGEGFKPYAGWRALDTLVLASWMFDGDLVTLPGVQYPKNIRLETLCEFFGIEIAGAHDALSDVLANVQLAKALVGLIRTGDFSKLLEVASQ